MTLQLRVIILLCTLLGLAAAGAALWTKGYSNGKRAGAAEVQEAWNVQAEAGKKETERIRKEGYQLATEFLIRLNKREAILARTTTRLNHALAQPAQCVAGDRLGDLLLPAELVDSMFNREPLPASAPGAAGPGPKPDAAVQRP